MSLTVAILRLSDIESDLRVRKEAEALAESGHSVTVVGMETEGLPRDESCLGFHIARLVPRTDTSWRRPLAKLDAMRRRESALADAILSLSPEVVHCCDTDTLKAGLTAGRRIGATVIYDAYELFPDMIAADSRRRSWAIRAYWLALERRLIPRADAVLTVGEGVAGVLRRRYRVAPRIVRNVHPLRDVVASDRLRSELGIEPDKLVILWQGMISPGRGLENVMEAMREVEGAVLVIQGGGEQASRVRRIPEELGLASRVLFAGMARVDALHEYACSADIGVVMHLGGNLSFQLAEPNKLFAYMMAGLPVAAPDLPGIRGLVEGTGAALLFDPEDAGSIAGALRALVSDPVRRGQMGERGRRLAETLYNWDVEKLVLTELYDGVGAARP